MSTHSVYRSPLHLASCTLAPLLPPPHLTPAASRSPALLRLAQSSQRAQLQLKLCSFPCTLATSSKCPPRGASDGESKEGHTHASLRMSWSRTMEPLTS